jgi:hypothetical protein
MEVSVACFKVLFRHSPEETEKDHEKLSDRKAGNQTEIRLPKEDIKNT